MSPAEKRPSAGPASGSEIVIEGLVRTFNRRAALDGITARIAGGRITGLVGPDGAGKTTLLRLLCGLLTPTGGRVTVCGYDTATDADAIHERINYMPQRFGLYEDLTVQENLSLYAELRSVPREERAARYEELLAFTGLGPFTGRLAGRLSGGMKQKLGLACTLLSRPPVLLLDEPGVGVDLPGAARAVAHGAGASGPGPDRRLEHHLSGRGGGLRHGAAPQRWQTALRRDAGGPGET